MNEKEREELREISQVFNGMKCYHNLEIEQAKKKNEMIDRIMERLQKLYQEHLYKKAK